MTIVNSVSGPVDVADLGMTLPHEHFIARNEIVRTQFPHLYDDEADLATVVDQVQRVMRLGVQTFFEPTVMGTGRDAGFMRRVATATGLTVIAATGAYTFDELPRMLQGRGVDYVADALVHDIEVGIAGTDIKAGFIKAATDKPGVTPGVAIALRAAARAHLRTGVPILTHSSVTNQSGLMQLDIFEEEGVDSRYVMIGHSGDTDDLGYLERILERGAWIGMDRYGLDDYLPTDRRNATVVRLCQMGYADRMFLSQDAVCVWDSYFPTDEVKRLRRNSRYSYILEEVLPDLRASGVTDEQIETMMVRNPAIWISGRLASSA